MKGQPEERAIQLAQDITERLYHLNLPLYTQAHAVLMKNKGERHIRGGMATRRKYRGDE